MKVMVDPAFPDHYKIAQLAEALGLNKAVAMGYVVTLWCRVMTVSPTGHLKGWSDSHIATSAGWNLDSRVFVDALILTKLLIGPENGRFIHDWTEWQGDIVKKRADWAARQAKSRESHRGVTRESRAPILSSPIPSVPVHTAPAGAVKDLAARTVGVTGGPEDRPGAPERAKRRVETGGEAPEVGSVVAQLSMAYRGANKGLISDEAAQNQIRAALAVGVKAADIQLAFWDPGNLGKKIWDILDPMRPDPKQASEASKIAQALKKLPQAGPKQAPRGKSAGPERMT